MLPSQQLMRQFVYACSVLLLMATGATRSAHAVIADSPTTGRASALDSLGSHVANIPYTVVWVSQYGGEKYDTAAAIAYNPTADAVMVGTLLDGDAGYTAFDTTTGAIQSVDWLTDETNYSSIDDIAYAEGADELYVAGSIGRNETYVRKYDPFNAQIFHEVVATSARTASVAPIAGGGFFVVHDINTPQGAHTLARYDGGSDPEEEWRKYFGVRPNDDQVSDLAAVGEMAYAVGDAQLFNPRQRDAWLIAFDGNGSQRWIVNFSTANDDYAQAVTVDDNGNVYVVGNTYGDLGGVNAGDGDIWIAKYSSSGEERWLRQLGSSDLDFAEDIVYQNGLLYVVGWTSGDLGQLPEDEHLDRDIILIIYDTDGNQQSLHRFGVPWRDTRASALAVDGLGDLYVAGSTNGNWIGEGQAAPGGEDALVFKLSRRAAVKDDEWVLTAEDQAVTVNGEAASSTGVILNADDQIAAVGEDGDPHRFDVQCHDGSSDKIEDVILATLESGGLFEFSALPSNCPSSAAMQASSTDQTGGSQEARSLNPDDVIATMVLELARGAISTETMAADFPLSINTSTTWTNARGKNRVVVKHDTENQETAVTVLTGTLSVTPKYQGSRTFGLDGGQSVTVYANGESEILDLQHSFLPAVTQ